MADFPTPKAIPKSARLYREKLKTDPFESTIERKVCQYAEARGVLQYKFLSMNYTSVPDRIFFPGDGRCFFIEFKRKRKKPTEKQQMVHQKLREKGLKVYVVDDIDRGCQVIDMEVFHKDIGC